MKPNEMTTRDYMAMNFACAAFGNNFPQNDYARELCAEECYKLADAMLEHAEKSIIAKEELAQEKHIKNEEEKYNNVATWKKNIIKYYPDAKCIRQPNGRYVIIFDAEGKRGSSQINVAGAWYTANNMLERDKNNKGNIDADWPY